MAYFADGRFMGDHFGPARYSLLQGRLGDSIALQAALKDLGADYFLVTGDWARRVWESNPQHELKLVYSTGDILLFHLGD
jgi:hypothetical protein